ncbi:hypothetical protein RJZ56_001751 [Blastomyces dermatitidis]|uniref:DUF7770 domain-containing protein n=1 Tax=Ajellomyces dermatitidis (strain ER-3 / ATCC MYA-2586) TaxID=559297 RepID=A0ABM9YHZ3_AJEDR|nr:uncharacterized protein BDCG_04876 [Blastomyces dermatitidis ER-3]EEQ89756.1 hypothetical protein BDCG_04876 [Blastomyces dermatitidis ER-3]
MAATISYNPPSLSSFLTDSITTIKAAAHPPDNISMLYLPTSHNTSVHLDLSPSGPGAAPACLLVSRLNYTISTNVVKTCNITVRTGTTVKTILDTIKSANYDRYKFAEGGQGCRFWVDKMVTLLQERQIAVNEIETQAVHNDLQRVWSSEGQPVPAAQLTGMSPGTFY